jgi:cholesterol oxidase
MNSFDYDVLVVGSGFGGSVAALRAVEKGYRVGVMEAGKRWPDGEIPNTQWNLPRFLWLPGAELYGIQRIEYLDDVLVLSGAGVGGGSHVYANTLYVPPKQFFDAPEWAGITDWADELAPCYDQAVRMLGVVRYPYMPTDVDRAIQKVAIEMGRGESFNKAPVGVYFGRPWRGGRRPVLRWRRAAPHRLHLLRELQYRLWPQRQEQAHHQLPVSGREVRRHDPRAQRGL